MKNEFFNKCKNILEPIKFKFSFGKEGEFIFDYKKGFRTVAICKTKDNVNGSLQFFNYDHPNDLLVLTTFEISLDAQSIYELLDDFHNMVKIVINND